MSYDETARALEDYTDHVGFERLVAQLLARRGIDVRPVGGSGDRGRDAVVGLYRAQGGEPLAVTVSLSKQWAAKIARDIDKMVAHGFRPEAVRSVTSQQTSEL